MPAKRSTFQAVLTAAIADIQKHGFDSAERVAYWVEQLRQAIAASLVSPAQLEKYLTDSMRLIYRRLIEKGGIAKLHDGVGRFTIEKVKPKLHAELERRIAASADLISLNRQAAIERTIQRFSGWASSVPRGGSKTVERGKTKTEVRKPLASLPFEERRVLIDQGHKFAASLSDIIATDGGAIAAEWRHHHVTYPREEHVARDGKIYLIRNSWAHQAGLVKPITGFTDQITKPGEEVLCRCSYRFLYATRDLPAEMLTAKGKASLKNIRVA